MKYPNIPPAERNTQLEAQHKPIRNQISTSLPLWLQHMVQIKEKSCKMHLTLVFMYHAPATLGGRTLRARELQGFSAENYLNFKTRKILKRLSCEQWWPVYSSRPWPHRSSATWATTKPTPPARTSVYLAHCGDLWYLTANAKEGWQARDSKSQALGQKGRMLWNVAYWQLLLFTWPSRMSHVNFGDAGYPRPRHTSPLK